MVKSTQRPRVRRSVGGKAPAARRTWTARQYELCELLDTDPKVIIGWEREGMPASRVGRAKVYDLRKVLCWLKDRWMGGGDDLAADESGLPSKRAAEIKVLIAREAKLRLQTELAAGRWISRDEVQARDIKKIHAVKAGMEALHRALTPAILELGPDPQEHDLDRIIRRKVYELLMIFSGEADRRDARQKRGEP